MTHFKFTKNKKDSPIYKNICIIKFTKKFLRKKIISAICKYLKPKKEIPFHKSINFIKVAKNYLNKKILSTASKYLDNYLLVNKQYNPLKLQGFDTKLINLIYDYSVTDVYREELMQGRSNYMDVKTILDNYTNLNIVVKKNGVQQNIVTEKDTVNYLLVRLKQIFTKDSSRTTISLNCLGIYSSIPSMILLNKISELIKKNKIEQILDYGAGAGLWASVFSRYFGEKIIVRAYDNSDIVEDYKIRGLMRYTVGSEIKFNDFLKNSLIILIFTKTEELETAIKYFPGEYLIFQTDFELDNEKFMMNKINKKWAIIKSFEPFARLASINSKYISPILLMKRRKDK